MCATLLVCLLLVVLIPLGFEAILLVPLSQLVETTKIIRQHKVIRFAL